MVSFKKGEIMKSFNEWVKEKNLLEMYGNSYQQKVKLKDGSEVTLKVFLKDRNKGFVLQLEKIDSLGRPSSISATTGYAKYDHKELGIHDEITAKRAFDALVNSAPRFYADELYKSSENLSKDLERESGEWRKKRDQERKDALDPAAARERKIPPEVLAKMRGPRAQTSKAEPSMTLDPSLGHTPRPGLKTRPGPFSRPPANSQPSGMELEPSPFDRR
jgi:hypothetical protein